MWIHFFNLQTIKTDCILLLLFGFPPCASSFSPS